ncbi:MAG: hypothetical protein JOZ77_08185 [Candidatus Eremiobacteraeota bacterium]|nr:hypothetical protein [Candidatus Eremiobacteraeota bacterium]
MSVTSLIVNASGSGPNANPGVVFEANEASGIYHEDREVAGILYRAYNATYTGTQWELYNGGSEGSNAWAFAQDSATGSLRFLSNFNVPANTFEPTWTTWFGSPNNTIFNVADYGMLPANSAALNTTAFQSSLDAALEYSVGGIVFIPAGQYQINGPFTLHMNGSHDYGLIIAGSSGATELVENNAASAGETFSITGFQSGRGIHFQDLRLSVAQPNTNTVTAISVANSQNITCTRVYFENYPSAMVDDNQSLQCGLTTCTVDYVSGPANVTAIVLSGSQDFVIDCVLLQQAISKGGVSGCTGIKIKSVSTSYVESTHINHFYYGIEVGAGGVDAFFNDVRIDAYHMAVYFNPGDGGTVNNFFFDNCSFALGDDSSDQTAGVYVDTNGAMNSNVASIFFSNCMAYGWLNAGIQINSGQNIVITGGQYSGNGWNADTAVGAGILITGGSEITITGADCTGTAEIVSSVQPYGIANIGGAASVSNCNLHANATGPIYASLPVLFKVTDCRGYNDMGTVVSTTAPANAVAFNGTSSPYGYYGPITFYVSSSSSATVTGVSISGSPTNLNTGGTFTLSPGLAPTGFFVSASITYTPHSAGHVPNFLMIGH